MDATDLDADPLRQLSTWLDVARAAGQPMPEAMTIASATSDAIPSARLVVLRGLQRGLIFFTDCESERAASWRPIHGRLPCCTGLFRHTARYAWRGRLSG